MIGKAITVIRRELHALNAGENPTGLGSRHRVRMPSFIFKENPTLDNPKNRFQGGVLYLGRGYFALAISTA
jgi:hypothetical protein